MRLSNPYGVPMPEDRYYSDIWLWVWLVWLPIKWLRQVHLIQPQHLALLLIEIL